MTSVGHQCRNADTRESLLLENEGYLYIASDCLGGLPVQHYCVYQTCSAFDPLLQVWLLYMNRRMATGGKRCGPDNLDS